MGELKIRDLVQAISGGPLMTVVELDDYSSMGIKDGVKCQWFDTVNGVRAVSIAVLHASGLMKYDSGTMAMVSF